MFLRLLVIISLSMESCKVAAHHSLFWQFESFRCIDWLTTAIEIFGLFHYYAALPFFRCVKYPYYENTWTVQYFIRFITWHCLYFHYLLPWITFPIYLFILLNYITIPFFLGIIMQEIHQIFSSGFPSWSSSKNLFVCPPNHSDDNVKNWGPYSIINTGEENSRKVLLLYVGQCVLGKHYYRNSVPATLCIP